MDLNNQPAEVPGHFIGSFQNHPPGQELDGPSVLGPDGGGIAHFLASFFALAISFSRSRSYG